MARSIGLRGRVSALGLSLALVALGACDDAVQPGTPVELDVIAIWTEAADPDLETRSYELLAPGGGACSDGTCVDDFGLRASGPVPPDGLFPVTATVRCPNDEPLRLFVRSRIGEDGPEVCDFAPVACSPEPQTLTEWRSCGGG